MNEYVVTFTNASYVACTEEPAYENVTVVCNVEPVDVADDPDAASEVVQLATRTWDDVDWTLDEPGWEAVSVKLPDGEVVDLG